MSDINQKQELEAREWNKKAISLNNQGRYEEAIRFLDKALELDPRSVNIWYNKGYSLFSLDRHKEAIYYYDKALELDPCCVDAWNNKGSSLLFLGSYKEAICCLDKALEFDPRNSTSSFFKAMAEDKLGLRPEAMHSYQQFLEHASTQIPEQIEYARSRLREMGSIT